MVEASDAFPTVDEAALAAHYLPRLRLFATRRLGDVSHGEDAAQESVRRVLVALRERRVRDLQALPAYVFEVARHVCAEQLRVRQRNPQADLADVIERVPSGQPDPLSGLISEERLDLVRRALADLPADDRELLRLTYEEELSSEQIGARLGLSAVNVRVRRHRIQSALHGAVTSAAAVTPEGRARR